MFERYIFSRIFKKRELRENMYSAKIPTFTVLLLRLRTFASEHIDPIEAYLLTSKNKLTTNETILVPYTYIAIQEYVKVSIKISQKLHSVTNIFSITARQ